MNKEQFIKKLESITGLDNSKCTILNSILESHFIIGKKNKEKIVSDITNSIRINKRGGRENIRICNVYSW